MASPASPYLAPRDDNLSPEPPSLDTLVAHLVAAKRSLACVEHVAHANHLVTSTRHALESHTVLAARTAFLRNGSVSQADLLSTILAESRRVSSGFTTGFDSALEKLDAAEARLRSTMSTLSATRVEPALRPADEEPKSLADFVDENVTNSLLDAVQEDVDRLRAVQDAFEATVSGMQAEAVSIKELLAADSYEPAAPGPTPDSASPVPSLLHRMEDGAQEMAGNLESLVKHYDLCVTAIKHTEGGGAVASELAQAGLPDGTLNLGLHDGREAHTAASGEDEAALEPMSDDERADMLAVLLNDAAEVDEVVAEIRDRAAELDAAREHVLAFSDRLAHRHAAALAAFRLLERVGARLPGYVTQTQVHLIRWEEEKARLDEHADNLDGLGEFYLGFLLAYDNLLLEVGRRKHMDRKIRQVRERAVQEIAGLVDEEVGERKHFRQQQGDFLPVDIWPGLMTAPTRYGIGSIIGGDQGGDVDVTDIPDISASVINKAIKRVKAREV